MEQELTPSHLSLRQLFLPHQLRRLLLCFATFACLFPVFSGSAAAQTPDDRVDAILRRAMEDRNIPGLQAAVVMNGKIVFSRSYGVANLQTPVPVSATTIFTLNSITKAFTGIAAMREVEKGRLDLSAPISRYLDDLPSSWGRVTVRQLFGQISGLPDINAYGDSKLTGIADEQKAWAWALTQPATAPGEKEDYCQTNLALVQRIINRLNGRSPDNSVIADEISTAGMVETRFGDSRDVIKNKSQPYRHLNAEGGLRNHFEQFGPMLHAGSGLNSTADDMARWMISVLDGQQINAKSLEALWNPVKLNDGSESSFAIGWGVDHHSNYMSAGMSGGGRSAFSVYPQYKLGVVILTNLLGSNPEELTDEIAAAFAPQIKLSGVTKLRAEAEKLKFANLSTLFAAVETGNAAHDIDQEALDDWITSLLWSGNLPRALELAKFGAKVFPSSPKALELLGKAYASNGLEGEATRINTSARGGDPANETVSKKATEKWVLSH